jgi:hypothetical protein
MVLNRWGCPLNAHHSPLLVTVVALILAHGGFQPSAVGDPRTQDTTGKQIKVRLVPKKKSIKVGEVLEVRVEIWNVGSSTVFIEKAIYELCGPTSPLSLRLELGPPMKPQAVFVCAADCIYNAEDSFASRLVYRWTTLPPGDFYGAVVAMHPDSFPQLNTPGRWRLRGTYKSVHGLLWSPCADLAPVPDNEEQIKGLPYQAWQGEVDTNTVWIEVARPGSSAPDKKAP